MPQTSLVHELQTLAQSKATDLGELLRRAKVVAVKLGLRDTSEWIEHELNGYPATHKVPAYRRIATELMTANRIHGAYPVMFEGEGPIAELAAHFSSAPMHQSLGELADLVSRNKSGSLELGVTPREMSVLVQCISDLDLVRVYRRTSPSALAGILDAVQNKILDWALELEARGVLGEGMTFSAQERQAAASVTIHNYGSLVQGDHASIATANNSPGANVTAATGGADVHQRLRLAIRQGGEREASFGEALQRLAEAISQSTGLPAERKTEATEQLTYIAEQAALPEEKRQPKPVLKAVIEGLRDTLGVSADVLQVWSTFGPSIVTALGIAFGS